MAWRLAKSLETLRSQVNTAYPNRSKISDGTIGDTRHAASASDHNPNIKGVVTALDLTNDPKNGFDAHKLADLLITERHSNLEYVISNSRIAGAWTGWKWQEYTGSNPHSKHVHISVGDNKPEGQATGNYDSIQQWVIKEKDEMYKGKTAQQWHQQYTWAASARNNYMSYYKSVVKRLNAMGTRPTKAQLEAAVKAAKTAELKLTEAQKKTTIELGDDTRGWIEKLINIFRSK